MINLFKFYLPTLFILCSLFSYSQNNTHIAISTRYGFIYPHRPSIAYLVNKHIPAFDLTYSKQLHTEKWHALYRYPYYGAGMYFANLGNKTYTGQAIAVYGFWDIPIYSRQHHSLNYSFALGIAYLTKSYDFKTNYYNLVIGSPINAFVDFGLYQSFYIKHIRINAGISYTHYSNGAVTKPNLGFNIPAFKLSLGYVKRHYAIAKDSLPEKKCPPTYEYTIFLAGGIRQNSTTDPFYYFANTLSVNAERYFSVKRKAGIGFDLFYDPSIPQRNSFSYKNPYTPYTRGGIHLSYDLVINRMSIGMHVGRYIWDRYLPDGWIYSRVGVRYRLNRCLLAGLFIKSHFAKADLIEFGLAYFVIQ